MFDDPKGPIEHFSWAKYVICGAEHSDSQAAKIGVGKDIRLISKKVTEWKQRKGHQLTPAMITGVYDKGIEVLIIGIGVNGALECPKEVRKKIKANGIDKVILLRTPDASHNIMLYFIKGKRWHCLHTARVKAFIHPDKAPAGEPIFSEEILSR